LHDSRAFKQSSSTIKEIEIVNEGSTIDGKRKRGKVGAGQGKPVILKVDAGRMYREGHQFLLSANGVWLTDAVLPGYLSRN
jgi:RNA:NAD 2'-phosphotransferase (TPT1/KptA family)